MPEKFSFSCTIPVRITDLNYGNHVGNDAFVSILHEARVRFLAAKGFAELNADGIGLIMADLQVIFKKEAFYGDIINIEISAENITNTSFNLYYHLSAKRENIFQIIAEAKTSQVGYNYNLKRVAKLPADFKASLATF